MTEQIIDTTTDVLPPRVELGIDRREHTGKYFFKRAFVTTFAILTAVSAFITAWLLIWGFTIGGLWSIGQANDDSSGNPTTSQGRQSGPPNMQPTDAQGDACEPDPGTYDC